MKDALVSIITPCYNGEKYLPLYLESLLNQTYPSIELYFVDDGSTDGTRATLQSYTHRFQEKGYDLHYIYQENGGQAAAMNVALPLIKGEFFTWFDSDDIMYPDAISTRVEFLQVHPDIMFCTCGADFVYEDEIDTIQYSFRRKREAGRDELFRDLILCRNVNFASGGGYMVRTEAFRAVVPGMQINDSRCGQNWQMILPLAYHYPCGYIDRSLYRVTIRSGSFSRSIETYEQAAERIELAHSGLSATVQEITGRENAAWQEVVEHFINYQRFNISVTFGRRNEAKKYYKLLKSTSLLRKQDTIRLMKTGIKPLEAILKILGKLIKPRYPT